MRKMDYWFMVSIVYNILLTGILFWTVWCNRLAIKKVIFEVKA